MNVKLSLVFLGLLLNCNCFSQYNMKKFKEGYVLRNKDTVKCKIFVGASANPEQVVFKYTDSKFEEPISYFAGSIIKGFGYRKDTVAIDFYAFSRKKPALFSSKNETVYGLILANGFLKLLEHADNKYRGGIIGGTIYHVIQYYLYRPDKDSAYEVTFQGLLGPGIDENILREYFNEYPELLAKIKKKMKLEDLIALVKEFNALYEEKKKNGQPAN